MSKQPQLFPPALVSRRTHAFTLVELLVALGLLGLVSTVLIGILSQSSALVSQGANLISLHQKSRSAVDRMAPYVSTAVRTLGAEAILIPELKSSDPVNPPYDFRLRFTTTEDFLRVAPPYNPRDTWDGTYHTYEFEFIRDVPADPNSVGRIELHRITGGAVDASANYPPRVIAHKVQNFRCLLINSNTIEVTVDTSGTRKGPQGNLIEVIETERVALAIPSESYR